MRLSNALVLRWMGWHNPIPNPSPTSGEGSCSQIMKNDFPRIVIHPEVKRKMIEIAREFRKEPTEGEKILWNALRGKKLDGIKFRRQQPVGYFIVDFYASAFRLVVEVDGPIHERQMEADKARQDILEELGLIVFRIKTETPEKNLHIALDMIRKRIQEIKQKQYSSSPFMGEGQGGG
jgi:very-short-patch-repair endonuclease